MRLLLLALFAFGYAGCLGVDSPDGALICADDPKRPCPQGFYCLAGANRCWRYGHFPEDMALPHHFNPGGPDEDMSVPVENDMTTTPDDLSDTD